jgi:type IV pilus assembly protein PilX
MKQKQQHGVVMIVALLFLVLFTIIGVAAMRSTSLEEKMAGASKDRTLAFESAEAALFDAESWVGARTTALKFDGSVAGLSDRISTGGLAAFWDDPTLTTWPVTKSWSTSAAVAKRPATFGFGMAQRIPAITTSLGAGIAQQPVYHIEYLGCERDPRSALSEGAQAVKYDVFRATAKSGGGVLDDSNQPVASVIVQRVIQKVAAC